MGITLPGNEAIGDGVEANVADEEGVIGPIEWYAALTIPGDENSTAELEQVMKACLVLHMLAANDPPMLPLVKYIDRENHYMKIGTISSQTTSKVYEYRCYFRMVAPTDAPDGVPIDVSAEYIAIEKFMAIDTTDPTRTVEFRNEDLIAAYSHYRSALMDSLLEQAKGKVGLSDDPLSNFDNFMPNGDEVKWQ